uniref:TNFR-Cys domain-containing protein n=1 Tax=Heligmosomoides polygyrus TaxID=6339 RepID=A0A8L8Q1Q6_HELPZ
LFQVILPTDCVQTALFSDGSSFYHASVTSQSTLHLIPLNDSFVAIAEPKSRHSVRLTDVSFCCMGDTKSVPYQLPMTIPKYLHNQSADLHLGKDIAFLQSRSGKIYYAGNGIKYGLQETGTTWMELVLPESIVQMSVGAEYVLFRAGSGHAWIAGGDDGRRAGKLRRLTTINRLSISSAAGSYGYVTDNGRVYVGGRHGMSVYPETGQVLGLDGTHMASLALGKTHAVAISKQGYVYTWGLNNLNQCGRVEVSPVSSKASPRRSGSVVVCEPSEHLFDVPSYCTQCGLCSARGSSCPIPAFTRKTGTCGCGPGETPCLRCGLCRSCGESTQQRPAGDTPTRTHLAPARVSIVKGQQNVKVSSVSCGNFHTILLAADGSVFSFGSNCHGQLGTGDVRSKTEPQLVVLPPDVQVVQVAAGANHTVLRTSVGAVYTFGAHKMGQLIRPAEEDSYWHATPARVPGFGPGCGSFATWIGAVGDATLIHSHTALIHSEDVIDAQLVASKNDLFIFPRQIGKEYVAVRRKHGSFAHHQLGPAGLYTSWCLESRYDILWSYNAAEMRVQASSAHTDRMDSLAFLRSPEWAVPLESPTHCSSTQLGISLLSCTYAAATISKGRMWNEKPPHECENYCSAFSGWGYSAHSIEAIQVKASKDVRLLGIGLYGGRGEYIAKIKLFRLPSDVSDEQCAEMLSESDETLYDCGQREAAALMLAQPVLMKANHWHVVSAKISGPSSDCGATGRRVVECDDVTFTFRNSAISNNGTDVNVGQIPELYYQVQKSSFYHRDSLGFRFLKKSNRKFSWGFPYLDQFIDQLPPPISRYSRYVLLVYRTNTSDTDEPSTAFAEAVVLLHSALLTMFDRVGWATEAPSEAINLFVGISSCFMPSFHLLLCHLALAISSPLGHPLTAAVVGSIAKRDKVRQSLLDVFLHRTDFIRFPQLSKQLAEHFTMDNQRVETLTTLPNILRFLYEKSFNESCDIVVKLSKELAIPDVHKSLASTIVQLSSLLFRFRRRSAVCAWDMSEGATDAICIRVDGGRIALRGVGVYLHAEQVRRTWQCEVRSPAFISWCSSLGGTADTGVILLPESISLAMGVTYAIKVWTPENGKTYCGEGGVNYIRLNNGARVTFSSCSLSENGTSLQRGQIPYFLYSIVDTEKSETTESFVMLLRLLSNKIGAFLVNGHIPQCRANLHSSESAVQITCVLEQLIPMVSSVNGTLKTSALSDSSDETSEICEAKTTQITVESPHPYKTNNVHSVVVGFDESVHFLCVQFSPSCETAQADDQLRIYMGVNKESYVPVGRYFGSKDWPLMPLLVPGNSLWFVLETTAEVDGVTAEQMYGFHCTVTGYPAARKDSNLRLEQELAWLSASACRVMVQLSSDSASLDHLSTAEEDTRILLEKHGSLLKKGLSLSHAPTLNEVIQKGLPQSAQSADLVFLREFLSACSTSTAGFLAKWLPSGPVVDPGRCQLTIAQTDMAVGKPVKIRLTTKDQFDREVMCSSMCVEVSMTAGDASIYSSKRVFIQNPFQPVLMNRCRYMSISAMPSFSNYSYEEIRLGFTKATVVREKINLKHKNNCTFEGEWTPSVAGSYRVACRVDGCELTHNYLIEVSPSTCFSVEPARKANIPATLPFQAIRMRLGTSLTAPSVGTIPRGGTIAYIEKIENEDGKWLRLTDETAVLYGHGNVSGQVWCLAYHQHLRRELIPIASDVADRPPVRRQEDPPALHASATQQSVIIDANETYVLDATQRIQLYGRPSPDALIEGAWLEGRTELEGSGWVSNQHGVWLVIQHVACANAILFKNSIGRSSIQSQSLSINGNDEEERSPPARPSTMASALRPSVVECCRAVFAAFLWHEHLVKDAMAAAAYLRFHQHLQNLWNHTEVRESSAPAALQPIVRLWIEVCAAVRTSVDQHLIVPPAGGKAFGSASGGGCELCDCSFKVPVTVHMRMNHPGCGQDAQGYGYNSSGKFTSGWSGDCGSGGRAASTWYLLCPGCRAQYLRKTPAGHRQERTRRWREFRLSTTAFDSRPEIIMRQNALFLLDLNSSLDCDSKASSTATSGWTINLFPTQTPSPSVMGRSGPIGKKVVRSLSKTGHASDPGPKALPTSPPAGDTREVHHLVLQSPSAALRTLISHHTPSTAEMLKRPVLAFVVEHHDLKRLRAACEQSIIRAIGFSHAFRVWNWLLRLVSSETSVSDIILQYLTALSSYSSLSDVITSQQVRVLPHPWRLCFLAGPLAAKMVQHLHAFLYTIAVILQSSGVDGRLRSLCFKAWTIQLTAHEQELLILTCNILGTVGGVLSDAPIFKFFAVENDGCLVLQEMRDVTNHARIEASSRQAMVVCLTDGSPETFWESGDEDKSRARTLNVTFDGCSPVLLCVFIDNSRDEACRTSQIAFRAATSDGSRRDLMLKNLDQNFCGWVKCCVANVSHVNVSLKGPHNASRVRQPMNEYPPQTMIRPSASHQLFFNNTQHDAFALFQAISAQAFSGDSCEQQDALRERVVDLLFSRVTLQPLQNYVCTQVEAALEREVEKLCSQGKRNYSYAVGLLAMANRMCETRAIGTGDCDVTARRQVLQAASRLLAFAPETVQTQCLSSLCSLLPTARPSTVDVGRLLRHLLVPVAKALVLQVRDKAAHTVTTACLTNAPQSWRTDRSVSPEIGKMTAQILSSGVFNEEWSVCMRRELATALLGVVQLTTSLSKSASLESMSKEPVHSILNSKRFWLSVAALALVRDRSWLALSEKWNDVRTPNKEPITLCENHDDGTTPAQVCAITASFFALDFLEILEITNNAPYQTHNLILLSCCKACPPTPFGMRHAFHFYGRGCDLNAHLAIHRLYPLQTVKSSAGVGKADHYVKLIHRPLILPQGARTEGQREGGVCINSLFIKGVPKNVSTV